MIDNAQLLSHIRSMNQQQYPELHQFATMIEHANALSVRETWAQLGSLLMQPANFGEFFKVLKPIAKALEHIAITTKPDEALKAIVHVLCQQQRTKTLGAIIDHSDPEVKDDLEDILKEEQFNTGQASWPKWMQEMYPNG